MLRSLAIKGRAKTSDPILNFVNGLPDGVAWNVLSFWRVERKKIVPSWNYADIGPRDNPRMGPTITETEISINQAKLSCDHEEFLCEAFELLSASEKLKLSAHVRNN